MFPDGADLPIFSETPQEVVDRPFVVGEQSEQDEGEEAGQTLSEILAGYQFDTASLGHADTGATA